MPITTESTPASRAGLTSEEARRRLNELGWNDPVPRASNSWLRLLAGLFLNPLVMVLLVAAGASALLGQLIEACIIAIIVALGLAINFLQTYRSQLAVERLRAQVVPTATVLRDGKWSELPRREVVSGDVIRLAAGDLVPADARLLESRNLYVRQGALTGESSPVEKNASDGESGMDRNRAESGPEAANLVFLGTSVVSGLATALVLTTGPRTLFGDIAKRLTVKPPETEFERGMRHFALLITRVIVFMVLFIVVVRLALHREALESVLFAVALGVGLTPEFLPMITSVTLAHGAVRMARRKVIVKHLPAIQNLGSIDILCSDKTGTLTTGNMTVTAAIDPFGAASPEVLRLARLNSYFETGLRSPLNTAILAGVDLGDSGFEKLDEIPFDFERRRTSIAVRSLANRAIGAMLIMKGAPESVLQVCVHCRTPNGPVALESELKLAAKRQADRLSEDGFRVLAVASREIAPGTSRSRDAETDMTLEGFLSFLDPPVKDARDIVAALRHDGVDIRILTGDNELVAKRICELTGIDGSRPVLGEEIERLSDPALEHLAENTRLFARVSPHQKVRIMAALRRRGHVVGFMGDGINDAPSLYAADVGISVASAVDVARDAAEIILTEPGLKILHSGIIEGRRAFGNVTKYLLMGTSSNFGNMFSMAAASLMLPFLPMLPAQILLNNFLYDLAQITIPLDHVDREFLRAPHRWDMGLIRDFMIVIGPVSSIFDFLTFYVLLHFLHASQPLFHTGWFVESLATQTLVLFVIRTARKPWSSTPSRALALTTVAIALAAVVIPWMPFAANIGFTPLPASYFAFLAGVMLAYLALVEFVKQRLFARRAARR